MERIKSAEGNEGAPKRLVYVKNWKGDFGMLEISEDMDLEKERDDYHKAGGSTDEHHNLSEWLVQHGATRLKVEYVNEN